MNNKILPGEKWLYCKIYLGISTSDTILTDYINPLINKLFMENIIEKWFFVRYFDPKFHIKLRFLVLNDNYNYVINLINLTFKNILHDGFIDRITYDTYTQEINKYNFVNIEYSESLFFFDSNLVLNLLRINNKFDYNEDKRWLISLKIIDSFFDIFSLNVYEKINIVDNSFIRQTNNIIVDGSFKKKIGLKYRMYQEKIKDILNESVDKIDSNFYMDIFQLQARNMKIKQIFSKVEKSNFILSNEKFYYFILNHCHMTFNRLFNYKNNYHELVINNFLSKYYKYQLLKKNK